MYKKNLSELLPEFYAYKYFNLCINAEKPQKLKM